MAEQAALNVAETLQTAHINRHPDPAHDLNPSTTASKKTPVRLSSRPRPTSSASPSSSSPSADPYSFPHDDAASDEIPISILDPVPRKTALPPLPDLRFEQSYLARMKPYSDAGDYKMVAMYTVWDHVIMPLTQGMLWRLAVFGWRHWNTGVHFRGRGLGARVRQWWWGVNGWKLPDQELL